MAEKLYDFHSHILPGIDDGCKDACEAVAALKESHAQGVCGVCLTPHFYAEESIEEFLARRQRAREVLDRAMEADAGPFPELCMGAEVAYYPDISHTEGIEKLCLGSSRYLLLELPFHKWGNEVLRDLRSLCARGITPILAHIDRYWSMQSGNMLSEILSLELYAQLNGAALLDWKRRGKAKRWLGSGLARYLGSDCHNLSNRAPNLGAAMAKLPEDVRDALADVGACTWIRISGR